ncbi:MAG: STAS domain-containing protein [Burkholderiales bacterium]|nr:MAG: STAS domain-containing protein [Burkholderiales bacterium]
MPVVSFPHSVTFATAPQVLDSLKPNIGGGEHELDLGGCSEFDSSLIAVVLELTRRAQARNGSCRVRNAPPNLRKLAALYGVDALVFGPA